MKQMTKPELEQAASKSITATLELLEELYIDYANETHSEINKVKLPFGDKLTALDLIMQLYRILLPLMEKTRREWPEAAPILEWADNVYLTVLVANKQEV